MHTALWILVIAAPIGAIDVVYFHMWKFRLFARPQSRREEITHLVREAIVPVIFAVLLSGRPAGTLYWIVAALFLLDALNSLADVMIEPASRAPIGVPPNELAIHFIGTTAMGAAWATYMNAGWPLRNEPTALLTWPVGTFPEFVQPLAIGALGVAVIIFVVETTLVIRYRSV
jgi:hypothetical protein